MASKIFTRKAGSNEVDPNIKRGDLLHRSASGSSDDNPFPQVASLRNKGSGVDAYSDRTSTAQRAARDRIDSD